MRKRIKDLFPEVRKILEESEEARNDDMELALRVFNKHLNGELAMALPFGVILMKIQNDELPPFKTIERVRRRVQSVCPELIGSNAKKRAEEIKEYKEIAKETDI